MENQNVRLAIVFVIGLVIGIGGASLVMRRAAPMEPVTDDITTDLMGSTTLPVTTPTAQESMSALTSDALVVANQPAGSVVYVSHVEASEPLWVAIHEVVNGKPGKVLGAGLFSPGAESGNVELLRATVAGQSYVAMVHTDDGDYHNYSSKVDLPTDVMVTFTAQ